MPNYKCPAAKMALTGLTTTMTHPWAQKGPRRIHQLLCFAAQRKVHLMTTRTIGAREGRVTVILLVKYLARRWTVNARIGRTINRCTGASQHLVVEPPELACVG
jgi:hypothetical protein